MSTIQEQLLARANAVAAVSDNMNEAVKGGGGSRQLPVGYAFGRLVEYVEFGMQPQEYNGKPKPDALEFRLGFALTGFAANPDDPSKPLPYANEDGSPYIMRTFSLNLSRNDKAGAFLLFKTLNWRKQATHFAQLLGQAFLLPIHYVQPKDTSKPKRCEINLKGILPPLDPVTQAPYPIAEARDQDLVLFLWADPTLESWKQLEIEGSNDKGESKDFIRNQILAATDFAGSPLEQLLLTSGTAFVRPAPPVAAVVAAAPAGPAVAPAAPNVQPAAAPAVVAVAAPVVAQPAAPFDNPATVQPVAQSVVVAPAVQPVVSAPAPVVQQVAPVATSPAVVAPVIASPAPVVVASPSVAMPVLPNMPVAA